MVESSDNNYETDFKLFTYINTYCTGLEIGMRCKVIFFFFRLMAYKVLRQRTRGEKKKSAVAKKGFLLAKADGNEEKLNH